MAQTRKLGRRVVAAAGAAIVLSGSALLISTIASANPIIIQAGTPAITTQPTNHTVNVGGTATFHSAASGTPKPTVQWFLSVDHGKSFQAIIGATTDTIEVTDAAAAESGDEFEATYTNNEGSATTNAATLTVLTPPPAQTAPVVTSQPQNTSANAGQNAVFTASASGNPTPTVQWSSSTDGGNTWNPIAGATSDTLTLTDVTAAENNAEYAATFTNVVGSVTTNAATLTVVTPPPPNNTIPVVTQQPLNQSVVAGSAATFTAMATGTPTPTVQWSVSTDAGKTFNPIAGATSDTLTVTATTVAESGNEYEAVFTNVAGSTTTSAATLTVTKPPPADTKPAVTTQPKSETVTAGQSATFSAAASGKPAPTVQWEESTNGGNTYSNLAGATNDTLTIQVTTLGEDGTLYKAMFTNAAGTASTHVVELTVNPAPPPPPVQTAPAVTGQPQNTTVLVGQNATFTATASGNPTPTVQWSVSTDGGKTWNPIAGATSDTLTLDAVTANENNNEYEATFSNGAGSATTNAATLTVTAPTAMKCVPPNGVLSGPINGIPVIGPPVAGLLCGLGL